VTDERPTPQQAWDELRRGNARFADGAARHPHQDGTRRRALTAGQAPMATVLGCSDSRAGAEIVFDQGLGDLFVVRNAGQVSSEGVVGSIEYAVAVLGTPLLVVLGHSSCGAVGAAVDSTRPDAEPLPAHIAHQIAPIVPVARRVLAEAGTTADTADRDAVGREHVRATVAELISGSEILSDAVAAGSLAIVGATYRLDEGTVVPELIVGAATDADV
jgi:carbonic anhydrase